MSLREKLTGQAQLWLRELGDEPTVILCGASAVLVASHYQGATTYFRTVFGNHFDGHPAATALTYFYWFGCAVLLYLVIPLLLSFGTRGSFTRNYGLGLGDWRAGLRVAGLFLAVMLPAVWVASKTKVFAGQYPLAGQSAFMLVTPGAPNQVSVALFVAYELGYLAYFVAWEFLFRGWMVNGLLPRFGRAGAVLIPVVPFAVMHLGKAEPEAFGSIIAAVALGILALRTRSIWYGFAVHGAVAVFMDWLSASEYLLKK